MKRTFRGLTALAVVAAGGLTVQGSSHREALAILNEPCADNTDTYSWVSDGTHEKLYLIMNFNPLHEPGQGNQGLRACNGYRYEFHIGKGASLADQVVYRVEFTNTLTPEAAPSPSDPLGGGNELLWQLTGGTETMKVSRLSGDGRDEWGERGRRRSSARPEPARAAEQSRPADGSAGLRSWSVPGLQLRQSDEPRSGALRSAVRRHLHSPVVERGARHRRPVRRSLSARRKRHLRPREPGVDRSGRHPRRAPAAVQRRVHRVQPLLDRARSAHERCLPARHPTQRPAQPHLDRQPHPGVVEHQPPEDTDRRCQEHHHRAREAQANGYRSAETRCRSSMPVWSARSARRGTCGAARSTT